MAASDSVRGTFLYVTLGKDSNLWEVVDGLTPPLIPFELKTSLDPGGSAEAWSLGGWVEVNTPRQTTATARTLWCRT